MATDPAVTPAPQGAQAATVPPPTTTPTVTPAPAAGAQQPAIQAADPAVTPAPAGEQAPTVPPTQTPPVVAPAKPGQQQAAAPQNTDPAVTPAAEGAHAQAPETYDLKLQGGTPLEQADIDAITALAKAHAWTNEQAQAALDEAHTSLTAQRATFRAGLEAHAEVGGEFLERTQQRAARVLDKFLPPDSPEGAQLRQVLNKSGYADFAPFALLLSRIGAAMGEEQLPNMRGPGAPAKKSAADRLFGDSR